MKLKDLDAVKRAANNLAVVRASYCNRFKNKRSSLHLTLMYDSVGNRDTTIMDHLSLDLSLEGPIAALVDQAYRKRIQELQSELKSLGVDLSEEQEGAVW